MSINGVISMWMSAILFPIPEPDYWEIAMTHAMKSKVIPYIPGV